VTCCLGFLGLVLVSITWATREEGATGILAAGFAIVLGVLVFGLALLAGLFLVAMVLLAVDAARNLRKLVRKMDKD